MADTLGKMIEKLSAYQIFNYLFPGIIFNYGIEQITSFKLVPEDMLYRLFVYYITGMILSRIGSTIIEPIYKKSCIVVYARYKDYLDALEHDQKLDILVMENNTFRTLLSTFIVMAIFFLIDQIEWLHDKYDSFVAIIIYLALLVFLFSVAFRKQTAFIRSKTHRDLNKNDKDEVEVLKTEQKKINLKKQFL